VSDVELHHQKALSLLDSGANLRLGVGYFFHVRLLFWIYSAFGPDLFVASVVFIGFFLIAYLFFLPDHFTVGAK